MFDRRKIKAEAKEVLRKYYWLLFLVCLLLFFFLDYDTGFKLDLNTDNLRSIGSSWSRMELSFWGYSITLSRLVNFFGRLLIGVLSIAAFLFIIFAGNPLIAGCHQYIAHSCDDRQNLEDIVKPLRNYYWNAVGTMFLRSLYIVLWSLLLIIPGIIKAYAYQFVPYLLEDEPNLSYGDILKKSAEMTRGIKFDLFVLDLSFLGWQLLNLVTFNLAKFFIAPYVQTSKALVYLHVRREQYYG